MRNLAVFSFVLMFSFFCNKVTGQSVQEAMSHPVIMLHYSQQQLEEIAQNDTAELSAIIYYFTASFIVEPIDCYDCLPFDSLMFDITKYEHLRKQDTVYTREFGKYGFRLTIVPVNSMPYAYDIHRVPAIDPGDKPKMR